MSENKEKSEFELILDLLKNWIRHWYYFVIGIFFCGLIGGIYYKLKTPEYEILAKVVLRSEDSNGGFSGMSLMKTLGIGKSTPGSNVEDEAIIMASHGPVKKMIRELSLNKNYTLLKYWGIKKKSLYDKTPVTIGYAENFTDTINAVIFADVSVNGEKATIKMKANKETLGKFKFDKLPAIVNTCYGDFTFDKTPYFSDYGKSFKVKIVVYGDDLQSEIYGGILNIEEERKSSDIIHLKLIDDNIDRGKDILKRIIQVHNVEYAKEKSLLGNHTAEFVDSRLDEVKTELDQTDAEIRVFKEKYGITDPVVDAEGYMNMSTELTPLLISAQTQLEAVRLLDTYLSVPENEYAQIPYVLVSGAEELTKAIIVYNEELSKRSEMFRNDKKKTPVSKSFDIQLNALRENLILALKNTRRGVEISVNHLEKKQAELIGKMSEYPVMEKTFLELKRNQELKQALYLYLQQKREETIMNSVTVNSKLRTIDEPYPLNKPAAPSLFKIMLIIIFFGGIVIPLSAISLEPYILAGRKRKEEDKEGK
ncbi:MAG: hypothetical protein LBJ72_11590 [Dysgonamonadaceae bacterium]|jgi:uncharacterized protein involved in exopolysaccharide biosynthesis|nr:hypothetical protein [Dysgonamonadaceae bacterium]